MQYYYRHTNTWHVPEMQFEAWVIYFEILSDGTLRFIDLGTALRLAHTAGFRTQRLQEESSVSLGEGGLLQPNSSQTGKERC